jgi:hypothetical protein
MARSAAIVRASPTPHRAFGRARRLEYAGAPNGDPVLAATVLDAPAAQSAQQPEHQKNDNYQAEDAAEPARSVTTVTIIAAAAAKQQDHKNNEQNGHHRKNPSRRMARKIPGSSSSDVLG